MKSIQEFISEAVYHVDGSEYNVDEVKLIKAFQDYSDQQIKEYKEKFKQRIRNTNRLNALDRSYVLNVIKTI